MLKQLFQTKKALMLGVDIGSHAVKAVLLSQHNLHYKVEAFAIEPMLKGSMVDSEIQDIEVVADALLNVRKKISKSIKYAAAAVSGSSVISKIIFMDASLTEAELARQIELESDSLIPYPLNEVSLDFERLSVNETDPSKVNVLLSVARTESVQARVTALESAGFIAKVVDVESFALSRAAALCLDQLPANAADKLIAVLNIGATITLLSIIKGDQHLYTRDIAFGGEYCSRSIMNYCNKTYEEAERAKIFADLSSDCQVEVLLPFQTMLVQHIRRAIQMYLATSGQEQVDYLLICGGSSLLQGMDRSISHKLAIKTVIANPFRHLAFAETVDHEELTAKAPCLMIATGLALRSFE
ncbi:pilus assembly protein PilM [Rheinheimera sediminis]|uniref:pilus assembly protein PilM n=1 Tax=Rheinheimera sp. YQF-1 TaxID=2499626 RepID=UPI000FD86D5E|nr:pilus assembly protein PilM [Rheinheimera sp. YQF-1]RVT48724.1 pilus assembly protein PilM [Rheinheimera sp. YQF-1]